MAKKDMAQNSKAKVHKVEQLTVRSISHPQESADDKVAQWVTEHALSTRREKEIYEFFAGCAAGGGENSLYLPKQEPAATKLMELVHGATVFDYKGQNLCISNCLTINPKDENVRQLIFFPDGKLRYDWQYPGAILL